jgi:hypothetical protein
LGISKRIIGTEIALISVLIFTASIMVSAQTPSGAFESQEFSISNMTAIHQGNSNESQSINILGIIKNISNRTIGNIQIVADFYDNSNQLIDVVPGFSSSSTLKPNGESSFKIEYRSDNNSSTVDHYIINVGRASNQKDKLIDPVGNIP